MILNEKKIQSERRVFTPNTSPNNIKSLILQYLRETGMQHSAFCFTHEAKVCGDKYMTQGRLLGLVEKGILFEQREKETDSNPSPGLPISLNRSFRQFKKKSKLNPKFASIHESMTQQMSLEELISSQVQLQLKRLRVGNSNPSSLMSQTHSNFSTKLGNKHRHTVTEGELAQIDKQSTEHMIIGKKSPAKGGRRKKREHHTPREPKSILKTSRKQSSRGGKEKPSRSSKAPKSRKSITIRDIKSLNCSEVKSTRTEQIASSKRYETQKIINVVDEFDPKDSPVPDQYHSVKKTDQTFNEGFSFGGSDKEDTPVKKPPVEPLSPSSSHRKARLRRNNETRAKSLYNNPDPRSSLASSSGEFVDTSKYLVPDSGSRFKAYEFRTFANRVIALDRFARRVCLLRVPRHKSRGAETRSVQLGPEFFSLTERFWKMSPFIALDQCLVFYTASQFIAFDYKYALIEERVSACPNSSASRPRPICKRCTSRARSVSCSSSTPLSCWTSGASRKRGRFRSATSPVSRPTTRWYFSRAKRATSPALLRASRAASASTFLPATVCWTCASSLRSGF